MPMLFSSHQRVRTWLSSKPGGTPHGLYYENCPVVQYGFFGHLEIISMTAVKVLTDNLEECHAVFAPCANDSCDKFGEFHLLKRKDSGTWVNWGLFYQFWVKIREVGKW